MKVCQVVASINEETGGPARSVSRLSIHLALQGVSSELFTLDYQKHGKQIGRDELALHSFPAHVISRSFRGLHYGAMQELVTLTQQGFELIHNHGLWMFPNYFARRAASLNSIPLVISPRGMLEQWSLQRSAWKKKLAWMLFEKQNLSAASMFHATSEAERDSIRKRGFSQPVAIIPNGVDIPEVDLVSRDLIERKYPNTRGKKWILFLSRIDPKKGADALIRVWVKHAAQNPEWHLLVAGPDLVGLRHSLEVQVRQASLEQQVTFTGSLVGAEKAAVFAGSEFFVLPTHSENFGIVIAEALASELPVITTHEAPWKELQTHDCGWWIPDTEQALDDALKQATSLPSTQLAEMGARGKALVAQNYSWSRVATQMECAYRWLIQGGEKPAFVDVI